MVNCGKVLVAAWFVALGAMLASLVVAIFTLSIIPLVTVCVISAITVVLVVVSMAYLCLVSLDGVSPRVESHDDDDDDDDWEDRERASVWNADGGGEGYERV